MLKKCITCKSDKSIEDFYKNKKLLDGLSNECKLCTKERSRNWGQRNKHRTKERNLIRYGISMEQYNQMLSLQHGKCAICGTSKPGNNKHATSFSVDHCHFTKRFRGLLCNNCNRALGLFKDNLDILRAAVEYLERC